MTNIRKALSLDLENLELKNIGQWPVLIRVMILLTGLVLAGYFSYQSFLESAWLELDRKEKQAEQLETKLENMKQNCTKIEEDRKEHLKAKKILEVLMRVLPRKKEEAMLLENFSEVSLRSGLKIRSIKPEAEIHKDSYIEHPMWVTISGDFHGFSKFLRFLLGLSPMVTIENYSLKKNRVTQLLDIQLLLKTYAMTEEGILNRESPILELNDEFNAMNSRSSPKFDANLSSALETMSLDSVSISIDALEKMLEEKNKFPEDSAEKLRSPFDKVNIAQLSKPPVGWENVQAKPRAKEALELYTLDSLQMVGFIQTEQEIVALIKDNGGSIHNVKTGNYVGQHEGKIIDIHHQGIVVEETLYQDSLESERRTITLPLCHIVSD